MRTTATPQHSFRGFLPVSTSSLLAAANADRRAATGYGVAYPEDDEDHNVLQLAYNLDYGERFAEHDKKYAQMAGTSCCTLTNPTLPSAANNADVFVTWDSKTIFKDDDLRRDYNNAELVSALGGADVGVMQPPFAILPREDAGPFSDCSGGLGSDFAGNSGRGDGGGPRRIRRSDVNGMGTGVCVRR
jgi:hypothetical protein